MKRYHCAPVRTFREVCECWSLVQQEYEKLGYAEWLPCGLRFALRDFYPGSELFITRELQRTVGTFTIVGGENTHLPSEAVFPNEIQQMRAQGLRVLEATKFAAREDTYQNQRSVYLMIAQLFGRARQLGVDRVVITVNPRHEQFWVKRFGFSVAGRSDECAHVKNAPGILLSSPVKNRLTDFGGEVICDHDGKYCFASTAPLLSADEIGLLLFASADQFRGLPFGVWGALIENWPELLRYVNVLSSFSEPWERFFPSESSSVFRGAALGNLVRNFQHLLYVRSQRRMLQFEQSWNGFSPEFHLPQREKALFALSIFGSYFLDSAKSGGRVAHSIRAIHSAGANFLFGLFHETGVSRDNEFGTPSAGQKEIRQDLVYAATLLSRVGGGYVVEKVGNSRYLVVLYPLQKVEEGNGYRDQPLRGRVLNARELVGERLKAL